MGKVQIIKKSRKENKCRKCGKVIPVGSMYYKGEINFGPTIVRCSECKLESWEVTTSDYTLSVGPIIYHYADNYDMNEDGLDELVSNLEEIRDDLQSRLDNMPESLQYGPTGELLQERIDGLDSAISDLESIDVESLKQDYLDENIDDLKILLDVANDVDVDDVPALESFDNAVDALREKGETDVADEAENAIEEAISENIQEAIGNILE